MMDSHNSLVRSEDPILTTVVGLDDVIVVSTADAVLVSARAKAEQVKTLVEHLKAHNYRAAIEHRPHLSSMGLLPGRGCRCTRYRVKRIVVKPGSKLSLQKHFHRSEHWVVVTGTAEVTLGNDVRIVHENEFDLYPDRRRSSARQSRQDPARVDRGASRQLSRRGRHRAPRRRLRTQLTAGPIGNFIHIALPHDCPATCTIKCTTALRRGMPVPNE